MQNKIKIAKIKQFIPNLLTTIMRNPLFVKMQKDELKR
jgi:hypothetical protein